MLLQGRKTWDSPDAAIREATASSPLRCRGIDYARPMVDGRSDDLAELVDAHSRVLAILGQFDEEQEAVLVGYAHGFSYAQIAEKLRRSKATARRWHIEARDEFVRRMQVQGLLGE